MQTKERAALFNHPDVFGVGITEREGKKYMRVFVKKDTQDVRAFIPPFVDGLPTIIEVGEPPVALESVSLLEETQARQAALHTERMDLLAAMVQTLRAENQRIEASNADFQRSANDWRERAMTLQEAVKVLQRVQFILGGHSGIIADCTDENVRENVERALSLMRQKVPSMIDALRAAAQDGKP